MAWGNNITDMKIQETDNTKTILPITNIRQCTKHIGYDLLSDRAKVIFKKKCKELIDNGIMSEMYLDMIAMYADEFDLVLRCNETIAKGGESVSYTDRYGRSHVGPHPSVKIRKDAMANMLTIGRKFGYSPKDRQGVKIKGPHDETELEKFRREMDELLM